MFISEDIIEDAIDRRKPYYNGILQAIEEEAKHYGYIDFDLDWWL